MVSLADRVLRNYIQMFHNAALYRAWSVELYSLVVVKRIRVYIIVQSNITFY
jgi:hypothetical protein